jgi:hypothetical protein
MFDKSKLRHFCVFDKDLLHLFYLQVFSLLLFFTMFSSIFSKCISLSRVSFCSLILSRAFLRKSVINL